MPSRLSNFPTVLILLSMVLFISTAHAQFSGGMEGKRGSRGDKSMRCDTTTEGRNGQSEKQRTPDGITSEQLDYRLSMLQIDLKVTADQNIAWQAFSEKVRAYEADMERARNSASSYAVSSPSAGLQHIRQVVDAARNRLTGLEDIETTAGSLYQTLTSDQKVLADMRIPTFIVPRSIAVAVNSGTMQEPPVRKADSH